MAIYVLVLLYYFPLSSLINHVLEILLVLTASFRFSNHARVAGTLVTTLTCDRLTNVTWWWDLRIQSFLSQGV